MTTWTKASLEDTNYGVPAITYLSTGGGEGNLIIFTREKESILGMRQQIDGNWEPLDEKNESVKPWCFKSGFSAVSRQDNQFDVIGIDFFNNVMHLSFADQQWKFWSQVGAGIYFTGTPALSKMNENRMDAFAIGNNNLVYHNTWTKTSGWSEWRPISENFGANVVAAASSGPTVCDVFVLDHEGKIRTRRLTINLITNDTRWNPWSVINMDNKDRTMLFNMSAVRTSPNKISLFSVGNDLNVYQCKINMFGVWKWEKILDGPFLYGVDAIAHQPDKITLIGGSTKSTLIFAQNYT